MTPILLEILARTVVELAQTVTLAYAVKQLASYLTARLNVHGAEGLVPKPSDAVLDGQPR